MRTEYGDEVNVCAGILLLLGALSLMVLAVAAGFGVEVGDGIECGEAAEVAGQ